MCACGAVCVLLLTDACIITSGMLGICGASEANPLLGDRCVSLCLLRRFSRSSVSIFANWSRVIHDFNHTHVSRVNVPYRPTVYI